MVELTHLRLIFLSYRNQLIDLVCKSADWFLYDGDNGNKQPLANVLRSRCSSKLRNIHRKNIYAEDSL